MAQGEFADRPEGPIVEDKSPEEIRAEPYNMPGGFEWSNLDVTNDEQRQELYTLLANNYVEDDDALFRFDYSEAFLQWALTPPGYRVDFLLGVRATASQKLVAFISAALISFFIYYGFEAIADLQLVEGIQNFGMKEHFNSISRGVLDTRDLLYFVSVTLFFLFLTKLKIDQE